MKISSCFRKLTTKNFLDIKWYSDRRLIKLYTVIHSSITINLVRLIYLLVESRFLVIKVRFYVLLPFSLLKDTVMLTSFYVVLTSSV